MSINAQTSSHLCRRTGKEECATCSKIALLDQKVLEAEYALRAAEEERRICFVSLNRHLDPFILRLPVELASRIFVACLPRPASIHVFSQLDDMKYDPDYPIQFLLSSVCQGWRRIALSTPQLWSVLSLHFDVNKGP